MNVLTKIREKHELSGYRVAKVAKIDRSYYRKIEIGVYIPSTRVATKIAKAIEQLTGKKIVTATQIIFMNHRLRERRKAATGTNSQDAAA